MLVAAALALLRTLDYVSSGSALERDGNDSFTAYLLGGRPRLGHPLSGRPMGGRSDRHGVPLRNALRQRGRDPARVLHGGGFGTLGRRSPGQQGRMVRNIRRSSCGFSTESRPWSESSWARATDGTT